MDDKRAIAQTLYKTMGLTDAALNDPDIAHLVINSNMVVASHLIEGLVVEPAETQNGVRVTMKVLAGYTIQKPVHLCFGMLPEDGLQEIIMDVTIEEYASVSILAHCTFPNAKNIIHKMEAVITIKEGASYSYLERHVHAASGFITVLPHAIVTVEKNATFKTDFELLRGKAGIIDINYETTCHEYSHLEMNAKVNGVQDDAITIRETGHLNGEGAVGVLTTRIAVRDTAQATVYNTLTAHAAYARGHVDCKEIIQDRAIAKAIPVVEVNHPKAHVTHEAAIGSVDDKQLQTLMARGLSEDEAVDLIIQGLLS